MAVKQRDIKTEHPLTIAAPARRQTDLTSVHAHVPPTEEQSDPTRRMLQLQGTVGNQAVLRMLGKRAAAVQRVFQPAVLNKKAHLRAGPAGVQPGVKTGPPLASGSEVVIDPAQQTTQVRKVFKNVVWTRAVDVTGAGWDAAASPALGGYIRNTSVAPKAYPQDVILDIASRGQFPRQTVWNVNVGEYTPFEASLSVPTAQIVKKGGVFKRLTAANQIQDMDDLEKTQINPVSRDDSVEKRIRLILTEAATTAGLDPTLIAKDENVEKLTKPLRADQGTGTQQEKDRWNTWSQNVYAKIRTGATEAMAAIIHWQTQLTDPARAGSCVIEKIDIEGSDLHDQGLGAMFVKFRKPLGGTGLWPDKDAFKVVIKPEDRSIEKSLFGTQATSLANRVNNIVGLNGADEITQIRMETHANFGSLIDFVRGQQARAINGGGADTQAMSEGIAFAFLAGMSDVHQDNVIWSGGKPYFIDADNSLNASRLQNASSQTGFSKNNKARTDTDIDDITNNPAGSRSAIVQSLLANSTPLLAAVQAAFTGKVGRVVPLYTNYWANRLKQMGYITADVGTNADVFPPTHTRWGLAKNAAAKVPRGGAEIGTGLVGESGIAGAGEWYDNATDSTLIKADLDQGKIPFYNYAYTSGDVLHNGQVVWHGQSLADAMAVLLAKFPAPPPPPPVVVPAPIIPVTS